MRGADMLEHADRHDAVVAPGFLAIIAQMETHAVRQAGVARPALGHLVLLGRQGHAGDVDSGEPGEVEGEPAPATADVEQSLSGLEQQLGGEMQLLVGLRSLEAVGRVDEISAGILPVAVEEQVVERGRKIVMVGDVPASPGDGIVGMDEAQQAPEMLLQGLQGMALERRHVAPGEIEEIVERAILDRQRALHIGFAERKLGLEQQPPMQAGIVQPHGHRRTRRTRKAVRPALSVDHAQRADPNEVPEKMCRQHGALPSSCFRSRCRPAVGRSLSRRRCSGAATRRVQ